MRCPLEEIGRNSVSPCTMPRMIAWMMGNYSTPSLDGAA